MVNENIRIVLDGWLLVLISNPCIERLLHQTTCKQTVRQYVRKGSKSTQGLDAPYFSFFYFSTHNRFIGLSLVISS